MKTTAIIPAGGLGKRFGGQTPKQFIELNGVPIMARVIKIFEDAPEVDSIVISAHSEWSGKTKDLVSEYGFKKVSEIVIGGRERQDSVWNALHTSTVEDSDIILVHDAVRPLASAGLVRRIIEKTEDDGAVIPGLSPSDTIKEKTGAGTVIKTLDRDKLFLTQTPQGFWQELIISAYKKAYETGYIGTDSSALVEFMGYKVQTVEGEEDNFKITTPLDIRIAEMIIDEREGR